MKTISIVRTTCTIALLLTILCAFSFTKGTHAASASQSTERAWRVVSSPNSPQTYNSLNGVVALSANDVWSVGTDLGFTLSNQPLIERWNGTNWHIVPSPTITASGQLNAVARIPGTQKLWAVGTQSNSSNGPQPLIERWDGTTWSVVPSPLLNEDPNAMTNILYGITALSANDAWAVGVYYQSGSLPQEALIEHWDGKQWSVVPAATPTGSAYSWLYGIAAFSAKDIWAVGFYYNQQGNSQTLVEHWNGKAWSLVSGANPGTIANFLYAVAPVPGTNQLWAVGNYLTSGAYQTLIERWNGTTWNLVTSPSPGSNGNGLQGVTALSATDAWAVGSYTNGNGGDLTLIEHWNGTNWSIVASPNPSTTNFLSAVAQVPHTSKLWAVGNYYDINNNDLTLTELYS